VYKKQNRKYSTLINNNLTTRLGIGRICRPTSSTSKLLITCVAPNYYFSRFSLQIVVHNGQNVISCGEWHSRLLRSCNYKESFLLLLRQTLFDNRVNTFLSLCIFVNILISPCKEGGYFTDCGYLIILQIWYALIRRVFRHISKLSMLAPVLLMNTKLFRTLYI